VEAERELMTAAELIVELRKHPPDAVVFFNDMENGNIVVDSAVSEKLRLVRSKNHSGGYEYWEHDTPSFRKNDYEVVRRAEGVQLL
jgi:hypothetical protein